MLGISELYLRRLCVKGSLHAKPLIRKCFIPMKNKLLFKWQGLYQNLLEAEAKWISRKGPIRHLTIFLLFVYYTNHCWILQILSLIYPWSRHISLNFAYTRCCQMRSIAFIWQHFTSFKSLKFLCYKQWGMQPFLRGTECVWLRMRVSLWCDFEPRWKDLQW